MSFADVHLAGEAVAALVDGELSSLARHRAVAHLAGCQECARAVDDQRHIATLLRASAKPEVSNGFLEKLCGIPMDTDLGQSDRVFAMAEGELVWAPLNTGLGQQGNPPHQADRVLTPQLPIATRSQWASWLRVRPSRRAILGGLAGLLVGVVASTTPAITTASTTGNTPASTPSRPTSPITAHFGQATGDRHGSVTDGQVVSNLVGPSSTIPARGERLH